MYLQKKPSMPVQVAPLNRNDNDEQIISSILITQRDQLYLHGSQTDHESRKITVIIQLSDEPPRKKLRVADKKSPEPHQCMKWFTLKTSMRTHIRQIHAIESLHSCSTCKKVFKQRGNLLLQVKTLHEKL